MILRSIAFTAALFAIGPVTATGLATCDSGDSSTWQSMDSLKEKLTGEGWQVRHMRICAPGSGYLPVTWCYRSTPYDKEAHMRKQIHDNPIDHGRACSLSHGTWRCVGAKLACAGACVLMVGQRRVAVGCSGSTARRQPPSSIAVIAMSSKWWRVRFIFVELYGFQQGIQSSAWQRFMHYDSVLGCCLEIHSSLRHPIPIRDICACEAGNPRNP